MHPSIIQTGSQLKRTTGTGLQLGCPLCPKFTTTRAKTICRHLESHVTNAVTSQGTNICRCNLPCRDTGHYHCPHCEKTIVRKEDMIFHVTGCQKMCNTVPPSAEIRPSVSSSSSFFLTPSASQQRSAQPSAAGENSVRFDHCYTLSPSHQPPSAPPPEASGPPAESSTKKEAGDAARPEATELPSSRVIYLKLVKCPHCSVVLYKKNLLVHIQRKHAKQKDITAACDRKTKCAHKACGLFDIPKGIHV